MNERFMQDYKRGQELLQKFKHEFTKHGIGDVFSSKQREYEGGIGLYEQGHAARCHVIKQ